MPREGAEGAHDCGEPLILSRGLREVKQLGAATMISPFPLLRSASPPRSLSELLLCLPTLC